MNDVLFITYEHNFKKTASSFFFYDFLCRNFKVEVVFPKNENISYSKINETEWDAVISFQFFLDFAQIKCQNKIFIPMYDSFIFSFHNVLQLKNVKIINFCKKLHNLSVFFGLKSFYIQYFPESCDIKRTSRNKIFYWQRRETSFSVLSKSFPENLTDIGVQETVIHSVNDNGEFFKPTPSEIEKYNIKITSWFEDINDLKNILDTTKYYIAPRKQEGIGMSFLDAMQHGAVVIAHNDCTMNEYIKNGYNGYLIDFENPKKITFKDYSSIQNNSINSIIVGRKKYEKKLSLLNHFIMKKNRKYINLISCFLFFAIKKLKNKF